MADQPRLLTPPRVDRFCPAQHCGKACSARDCTCPPCRCPDCKARRRAVRRTRRVGGVQANPVFVSPPTRLFYIPTER